MYEYSLTRVKGRMLSDINHGAQSVSNNYDPSLILRHVTLSFIGHASNVINCFDVTHYITPPHPNATLLSLLPHTFVLRAHL